jgi:hypothetical protein
VGTGPLSSQRPFLSAESAGMLRCMVSWSEVEKSVNADASALVIEWWRPDRGLVEVVRA